MKQAIICFTRVPQPGKTKTRLLPVLRPEQCAGLHWAFLRDLARVYAGAEGDLFVAYTPDPDWERLKAVFPGARGFFPQEGSDLGQRMHNAIASVLNMGYEVVVLTGADLPLMQPHHLDTAFSALETADVTIGPTSDGGYYLIGMKKPREELFHVEGYGGANVYEDTIAAAAAGGLSVQPGILCDDVDTPEDLKNLLTQGSPESHTLQYLQKEGIVL